MVFRQPRVHVKPKVQSSRPSNPIPNVTDPPSEPVVPPVQNPQTELPVETSVQSACITVPEPNIEQAIKSAELPPPPPPPPAPISPTKIAEQNPVIVAENPSASTSNTTAVTSSIRPFLRRKIAPKIDIKTAIHHRRPSASCSGTESESESSRQRHITTSSISFHRTVQEPIKTTSTIVESTFNSVSSDLTTNDERIRNTRTKSEIHIVESVDQMNSSMDVTQHSTTSAAAASNLRISRENISLHIAYRAQRRASKVEPDKTIRKRRTATLDRIDKTNSNKDVPIDTSKLTIADFVHYNPVDNPMESKPKNTTVLEGTPEVTRKQSLSGQEEPKTACAPQLKIDASGSLVLDQESLFYSTVDETPRNTVIIEGHFNDDNLTHRSYRKIGRRKRWNHQDTLRFYQALRMFGTDFTLISKVFPDRDRNDIKRKFKTEDKANRTLVDSALSQRIPFDLTCFYSPSEGSSDDDASDMENVQSRKSKRRKIRKKGNSSSDPLEINLRREKRLQAKKNSLRSKKSVEFIDDDDDDDDNNVDDEEHSIDIANTVEVETSGIESKMETSFQPIQNDSNAGENSIGNIKELENLLGRMDGGHLLFVHNTDETTGLDRIDVHVVMPNETTEHQT